MRKGKGPEPGSGSAPLTNGSGSGRPKTSGSGSGSPTLQYMFHCPAELQHNRRGGGGSYAPPVQHRGRHTQVPPLREVRSVPYTAYPVHQLPLGTYLRNYLFRINLSTKTRSDAVNLKLCREKITTNYIFK